MSDEVTATNSYIESTDWDPYIDYLRITLMFNDKQFIVEMSREHPPGYDETDAIEEKWLDELQAVANDDAKETIIMRRISHSIEDISLPFMQDRAPAREDTKLSLHMCLNPETFTFQMATMKGKGTLVQRTEEFEDSTMRQTLEITSIKTDLPLVHTTDIEVVEDLFARRVFKALVNGQERCCKIGGKIFHDSFQREFDALRKIQDANPQQIRVPSLEGIVKGENGDLIGIITEYVQTEKRSLAHVDFQSTPKPQRVKWVTQIQDTIRKLHDIGVVWGDAKTDNVLIDKSGDAWIVDFGGGRTHGWIDEAVFGTPEGDLEGVKKIIDALQV
jgi:serine/threonine protein kinase